MKKLFISFLFIFAFGCSGSEDTTALNTVILVVDNERKVFHVEGTPYFDENEIYVVDYIGANIIDPAEKIHFVIPYNLVGESAFREFSFGKTGVYYFHETINFTSNVEAVGDNFSGTFTGIVDDIYNNEKTVSGHFLVTQ
jgi:hypothetical protein